MYYVFMAEHCELSYLPPANVRPIANNFPNYFTPSVRDRIYRRLHDVLKSTTDDVAREFGGSMAYVPPFSAIVLDRAARPEELGGQLLALREEYRGFRHSMLDLEHRHRGSEVN